MKPVSSATAERAVKAGVRTLAALIVLALLLYPGDWLVWRLRVASGGGMGQVDAAQITAAELKNNKEEYYTDEMQPLDCSLSLFAHGGYPTCRQLRQHKDIITRY